MYRSFDYPSQNYSMARRRRRWAQGNRGLEGYSAFLSGMGDGEELGAIVGSETAAFSDAGGSSMWRSIGIGVATGALTFLVNHWLGKVLK